MARKSIGALVIVLALHGAAFGAARIVTPALPNSSALCSMLNASESKEIEASLALFNGLGEMVYDTGPVVLGPGKQVNIEVTTSTFCAVTVLKGSKSSVRVSYTAFNGDGSIGGTIAGQ